MKPKGVRWLAQSTSICATEYAHSRLFYAGVTDRRVLTSEPTGKGHAPLRSTGWRPKGLTSSF